MIKQQRILQKPKAEVLLILQNVVVLLTILRMISESSSFALS